MKCKRCGELAAVKLPSHHAGFCPTCFEGFFKKQVETAVRRHGMIGRDEKVLVAVSGGKDSLALMRVLTDLGHVVEGLHVHLGIPDSSDPVAERTRAFCAANGLTLHVLHTAEHGLAVPDVKDAVRRPVCAVCGKIKRHYFNRFAYENGFAALATGHNLDDETARLFANVLRWDPAYLGTQGPTLPGEGKFVRKIKPLYRLTEFETAAYCFLKGIDHWKAACPYSGGASFTGHKKLIADLEDRSPGQKTAFYEAFLAQGRPHFAGASRGEGQDTLYACAQCGFPSSGEVCGVCRVREQVAAHKARREAV
ncbi:MAG: putative ATPase of the PP-loop superfamily implicated in cell cycle control [Solidesulfovibrio magneticus str. Maddingley MBC34]|uniref:Putative ATPase of the PP-loop superfamily implicated in cell cycle control n=1 Tax=Solidesulfovibrio magneticus str. Maddingley MBC34 TaxID=1206767 RepID=K6GMY0_9BACT|nr:MAG: putative ATPase of the PP-loop superfamily implicated in cell cycle control [Solidesulfovibrio magneticus str. Maddingley MBC34]